MKIVERYPLISSFILAVFLFTIGVLIVLSAFNIFRKQKGKDSFIKQKKEFRTNKRITNGSRKDCTDFH